MSQPFNLSNLPPHVLELRARLQAQREEAAKFAIFPLATPTPQHRQRVRIALLSSIFLRTFHGKELPVRYGMWNGLGFLRESSPYSDRFRRLSYVSGQHLSNLTKFCFTHWKRDLADFDGFQWVCWLRDMESETETDEFLRTIWFLQRLQTSGDTRANKLALLNEVYMKSSDKIPVEVMEQLTLELANLEKALLEKDPMMKVHLQRSHKMIQDYPETQSLLEDHEIARIIDALEIHTKTEIVKVSSKPAAAGRRAAKVTIDDL